jgi:hypothetical protein
MLMPSGKVIDDRLIGRRPNEGPSPIRFYATAGEVQPRLTSGGRAVRTHSWIKAASSLMPAEVRDRHGGKALKSYCQSLPFRDVVRPKRKHKLLWVRRLDAEGKFRLQTIDSDHI